MVGCVAAGLASTALVLSIALPFGGNNWYWLTALSPLAGGYYWQRGNRMEEFQVGLHILLQMLVAAPDANEMPWLPSIQKADSNCNYTLMQCVYIFAPCSFLDYAKHCLHDFDEQVKMVTADDESVTDILIEGAEEEAERLRKELSLAEKGKVYVKGLLES